jgi:hypothetical protein
MPADFKVGTKSGMVTINQRTMRIMATFYFVEPYKGIPGTEKRAFADLCERCAESVMRIFMSERMNAEADKLVGNISPPVPDGEAVVDSETQ